MRLRTVVVWFWAAVFLPPAIAVNQVRLAVSTSWNMPYAKYDKEQLSGGIIFDLAQSVEKALAIPVVFVPLPRKRIDGAALAGDYDLRCYVNPQWTEIPDKFFWSLKLFDLSNVVFGTEVIP